MNPKKKFSDTKVGKFLANVAPHIFDVTSSIIPTKGILGLIKGLITKDSKLTPKNKEEALKLLDLDIAEMQEVSKSCLLYTSPSPRD